MSVFGAIYSPAVFLPETEHVDPTPDIFATLGEVPFDICVKLEPYSSNSSGVVDIYLSQFGFVSDAADNPASTAFAGIVLGYRESRRLVSRGLYGGRVDLASGEILISTASNAVVIEGAERTVQELIRDYTMGGRMATVKLVTAETGWSNGYTLFMGECEEWDVGNGRQIRLPIRGRSMRMEVPVQPAKYSGTGGVEGPDDLKGKPKPVTLDRARQVFPVLESSTDLLYRVHTDSNGNGAAISTIITSVYVGGVLISVNSGDYATTALLLAASVPSGQYATCYAEGAFRLGTTPSTGARVTCNTAATRYGTVPSGAVSPGLETGIIGTVSDLLQKYGPQIGANEIDWGLMEDWANAVGPAINLSLYYGANDNPIVADVLDEIGKSTNSYWTITNEGKFSFRPVKPPGGNGLAAIGENEIHAGSWKWLPAPEAARPYVSEVTVRYDRRHSFGMEIASGASSGIKEAFEVEWLTDVTDQAVDRYAEGSVLTVDTALIDQGDAASVGALIAMLYNGDARRASFSTGMRFAWLCSCAKSVLSVPDVGISGQSARIMGRQIDTGRMRVTFDVAIDEAT